MTAAGVAQAALFLGVLTALTPVLGSYLERVFERRPLALDRLAGPPERALHAALRIDPTDEQDWKQYARSAIVFSAVCFGGLYLTLRTQGIHPWNPQGFDSGTWDVSFNTAASFVSNTSWQFYAGETTLSNFSQMAGIAVHSFLSAAVGLAAAIAVVRGFSRRGGPGIGNFWGDLIRSLLYVLVPIAVLATFVLVSQGVVQSLAAPVTIGTLAGGEQTLVLGPVASQVVIKTMGSVGGGFFNVNSAMPFENATGLASFVQALLIVLIPAALTSTFGRMVGSRRQGWMLYAVMAVLLTASVVAISTAEHHGSPALAAAGLEAPNLEGKEQRFGTDGTALFAAATTGGASGAVNGAMEAFTGLGAAVPMANMMTGEVVFGGIGSGLSSMLMTVLLAVFIGGLMVGRTPEYLGKQIGAREVKLVLVGTLAVPLFTLACVALGVATSYGRASLFSRRSARVLRDALRLRVPGVQQRLGVRGLHRLCAAERPRQRRRLRHHLRRPARRNRDARGPLPADDRRAGHRRGAGLPPPLAARGRHVAHRHARLRRPPDRNDHRAGGARFRASADARALRRRARHAPALTLGPALTASLFLAPGS